MKKADGLSISARIAFTRRAYRTIKKYCPGLMQTTLVRACVTALQPFATIWFSAQIINEIAGERNIQKLIVLALSVVVINFSMSMIKGRIDIMHGEREQQMWCYFGKIFADKQLSMDYVDIENAHVQKRKDKEKYNLFNFGNGLAQFVWTINTTIEGAVSVIVSSATVTSLFTSITGNATMDSAVWVFVVMAVIFLGVFVNAQIFNKNNAMFMAWCEKTAPFNRLFGFFAFTLCKENDRAMDVRIYGQDIPADAELYKLEERDKSEKTYYLKYNTNEAIATLITGLNYVVCYLFVSLKAFFGAFGVGSVVQYVGVLGRFGDGMQKLVYGISDNAVYTIHLKNLFEFLDMPNKKCQGTLPVEKRANDEYELAFRNVSFKYPGTDRYVLKNVNLKFNIGQRMAVVGMNGSGKTTMIKLLCRLYDPTEGEITLNGFDIREYDYNDYMRIFSVVFQDFKLFSFSLGQNVAVSVAVDDDHAEDCLKKSGFSERLSSMPKGLNTPLYKHFEEEGVEISGGEAQKIALARALYKDTPFIILDEPTAALDPIAEFDIYSKFNEIVGAKTAIYISHRLASCRFCGDIAVFHEGELIQRGNHDALVADVSGKYYELWTAQAQYYKDEAM